MAEAFRQRTIKNIQMITHDNFRLLEDYAAGPLLLLGSQTMNILGMQGRHAANELNCDDLDINGQAKINFDLSKFKAKTEFGPYNTIADFGTLEHVGNEGRTANAIRNVFEWLVPNGTAIHVNPSPSYVDPYSHKDCIRFTTDFWKAYATESGMDLIHSDYLPAYALAETAIETRAVLKKVKNSKPVAKKTIVELIKTHCQYV